MNLLFLNLMSLLLNILFIYLFINVLCPAGIKIRKDNKMMTVPTNFTRILHHIPGKPITIAVKGSKSRNYCLKSVGAHVSLT